ncbi:MAG: hypothetical protein ACRCTX_26440 [Afipia sp.]
MQKSTDVEFSRRTTTREQVMNQHLAFVADTLETAEVINNLVRTNLRDGGYLLAEFMNFGGHANEHAAAKLFKAAPKLLKAAAVFEEYCEAMEAGDDVTAMFKFAEAHSIRRAAIREATE